MKSVPQMYAESFDLASAERRLEYPKMRPQAELHLRFWLPVAEMLNPYDHTDVGAAGAKFYEVPWRLEQPHAIAKSIRRMKSLLGVERLPQGDWWRLWPVFRDLLSDAQGFDGMDRVVCMVRQLYRLEVGHAPETGYEDITIDCRDYHGRPHEFWAVEEEPWCAPSERQSWPVHTSDFREMVRLSSIADRYEDAEAFESFFAGMGHRRLKALAAIRPILLKCGNLESVMIEAADRYMQRLLSMTFEEPRLNKLSTLAAA